MKKYFALFLALLCVLMAACGNSAPAGEAEAPVGNAAEPAQQEDETQATDETEATEANRVAESYPVVVLDNEYVRITVEGKFTDGAHFMDFGYNILIENKCDQYVMVVPKNCSVNGSMLPLSETPFIDTNTIAPGMSAQTFMFYMNTDNNITIKTVDDLVNFDGQWQLAFSEDGSTFSNFQTFNFDYILP